ncbi:hypothetical protein [Fluviispira sanaruensis]|uniref:Phytanoyl-CoA dioxygenase n=1 Tax=Fluviispira sanaruensis TaxID=2493639 RepID=A0A4P2VL66_FLUSA|nr:hypothetical protein [Fluviispira sanaruensis]BBH54083.1 hypothetical protein JCM31447_25400 [Fluviispira sanaruensis]
MTPSQKIKLPEIYKICFHYKIVLCIHEVFGENYYKFNDFQAQRNSFRASGNNEWHIDCGSEARANYLHRNDNRQLKCGTNLQDNTIEWGEGIYNLPMKHKIPIDTFIKRFDFRIKDWNNLRRTKKEALLVPIKTGNFVAFDSRIIHTSVVLTKLENPLIEKKCF